MGKEKRYFSQSEIQKIVSLLGTKVFYEDIIKNEEIRGIEGLDEVLKRAIDTIEEAVGLILSSCEENQYQKLMRCNGNYVLMTVPKYDPRASSPMALIAWDNYEYLLYKATEDCMFCTEMKSKKEVKECKLRKALLETGIVPTGCNAECGFAIGERRG